MKKQLAILTASVICFKTAGQVSITLSSLHYTQDFNTLAATGNANTWLPQGWAIFEPGAGSADYRAGEGTATAGDTYSFGPGAAPERALGAIATGSLQPVFGAKFVNNTGRTVTGFTIAYKGEQWRLGNASFHDDTLRFQYSTTAVGVDDTTSAANWITEQALSLTSAVNSGTAAGAMNGNLNFLVKTGAVHNLGVPDGGSLVLRWCDVNIAGNDDGLAVDSLTVLFHAAVKPVITATVPANNADYVPVSSDLQMSFSSQVTAGPGSIRIINETGGTVQTLAAAAPNVQVNGNHVSITGVPLVAGAVYHVSFDSTAFDTAGHYCTGLYDSTLWRFSTVPVTVMVNGLNEDFKEACTFGALPYGWSRFSAGGAEQWACATGTGTNTTAVYEISGNGNANEDWLITPGLDLDSVAAPVLHFICWKKGSGEEPAMLASYDYPGYGDPGAASWTELGVSTYPWDTGVWKAYDVDLAAYKTQPVFVAFRYVSGDTGGYHLRIDNIVITGEPLKTAYSAYPSLSVNAAGNGDGRIRIWLVADSPGAYFLSLSDMSGRCVHTQRGNVRSGEQCFDIQGPELGSGMYMIRMMYEKGVVTQKLPVP